jgi:hypothetical protein
MMADEGVHLDALRVKAFPFNKDVEDFIESHDKVFVVEQNRDGQFRKMLIIECDVDPKKLLLVRHYNGSPITARTIKSQIHALRGGASVTPIRRKAG